MSDLLGKQLLPGDLIAYNTAWSGLAIGIVYKADEHWLTFHDMQDGRQRIHPSQCALLDATYRGENFTVAQDALYTRPKPDVNLPHDILHHRVNEGDTVVFCRHFDNREIALGRVREILPRNVHLPHPSKVIIDAFGDDERKPDSLHVHVNSIARVTTPYDYVATPLLRDLLGALGT